MNPPITIFQRISICVVLCVALSTNASLADDCEVDFGDRLYQWVERDAARQAIALAEADFRVRINSAAVLEYDDLYKRFEDMSKALDAASSGLYVPVPLPEGGLGAETALNLQRSAATAHDHLIAQRANLDDMKRRLERLSAPPTFAHFRVDGLEHVGRSTLLASIVDLGRQGADSLNERFGFYVSITFDSSGNLAEASGGFGGPEELQALDSTAVVLLYYGEGYSKAIAAIYLGVRALFWGSQAVECQEKIEVQKKRAIQATKLLGTVLPTSTNIYTIYTNVLISEQVRFADVHSNYAHAFELADKRWRGLMAINLARAEVASKTLTAEKVEALRRAYAQKDPLGEIFDELALAQMTREVGRLLSYNVSLEARMVGVCRNVEGVQVAENLLDSRREALAQLACLRRLDQLAPLHNWFDRVNERLKHPLATVDNLLSGGGNLDCKGAEEVGFDRARAWLPYYAVARNHHETGNISLASVSRLLQPAAANFTSAPDIYFCAVFRDGQIYHCGRGNLPGVPFSNGFPIGGGSPFQDITTGAHDGGRSRDSRRVGGTVKDAQENIEERIRHLKMQRDAVDPVLPQWSADKSARMSANNSKDVQKHAREDILRDGLFSTFQTALGDTQARLTRFSRETSDMSILDELVRETDTVELGLPNLLLDSIVPEGPVVSGFRHREHAYPGSATQSEMRVIREQRKAEALPKGDTKSQHNQITTAAEKFVKSHTELGEVVGCALLDDAASLRYHDRGLLRTATVTTMSDDGKLGRSTITGSNLPPDSVLARVARFNSEFNGVRSQQAVAEGGLTPGAVDWEARQHCLKLSVDFSSQAARIFFSGDLITGDQLLQVSRVLADLATSWLPGVSWARDIYEAVTGRDLITGEDLDSIGRVGAIVGAISGGIASKGIKSASVVSQVVSSTNPRMLRLIESFGQFAETAGRKVHSMSAKTAEFSQHALDKMRQLNISAQAVRETIELGQPYLDVAPELSRLGVPGLEQLRDNTGLIFVARPDRVGLGPRNGELITVAVDTSPGADKIVSVYEMAGVRTFNELEVKRVPGTRQTRRFEKLPRKSE